MASDVYEVWDTETGNVLAAYPTEAQALEFVRVNVREHGTVAVSDWVLVRERRGHSTVLAEGAALAERALAESTHVNHPVG